MRRFLQVHENEEAIATRWPGSFKRWHLDCADSMGNFSLLEVLISRGIGRFEDIFSSFYPGANWELRTQKHSKSVVSEYERFLSICPPTEYLMRKQWYCKSFTSFFSSLELSLYKHEFDPNNSTIIKIVALAVRTRDLAAAVELEKLLPLDWALTLDWTDIGEILPLFFKELSPDAVVEKLRSYLQYEYPAPIGAPVWFLSKLPPSFPRRKQMLSHLLAYSVYATRDLDFFDKLLSIGVQPGPEAFLLYLRQGICMGNFIEATKEPWNKRSLRYLSRLDKLLATYPTPPVGLETLLAKLSVPSNWERISAYSKFMCPSGTCFFEYNFFIFIKWALSRRVVVRSEALWEILPERWKALGLIRHDCLAD